MTGLRQVAERMARGPITIAYMGNSVTAQRDGYRTHLHDGLEAMSGRAHRAVNAGFGGVGSIGSVCTMDDWVIRHRPNLCFIESLTGDLGVGLKADTGAAVEGMLRKLAAIDCAACFLNLPRQDVDGWDTNPLVVLYRQIAAHHGVPQIDLGSKPAGEGAAFFRDVVHTTPEGGRRTAALILEALKPAFASASAPGTARPLFARDFGGARVVPAEAGAVADPAACGAGRFRLVYPYLEIAPGNRIVFRSASEALLGLLIVAGPHCGLTRVNGQAHQLRDKWCFYDRLHATTFDEPFEAGEPVAIEPLDEEPPPSPPPRLKLIGFLVR